MILAGRTIGEVREDAAAVEERRRRTLPNLTSRRIFLVDTEVEARRMKTRVQKWGNSLALRLPKAIAAEANLENGAVVEVSLVDGKLVIVPLVEPVFTLHGLLAQVTDQNLHHEIDTGPAIGHEVW